MYRIDMDYSLIPNRSEYWGFIRRLRNNPKVRTGFVEQDYIFPAQQTVYMEKYGDRYYVCLYDGEPVGYIGEIDNDLRLAVFPDFQRRGVGSFMLWEFMKLRPNSVPKVLKSNIISQKFFEKAGFVVDREDELFYYYKIASINE